MNKKKTALFSTNFLEYSQTFIYDEIKNHREYEVEVFCHSIKNEKQFPYETVHYLNKKHSIRGKLEWLLYGMSTYSPSFMRKIKDNSFDVIHAHFGLGSIYALPYKRASNAPLIVTFHGYDLSVLLTKQRFYPKFLRYWLRSKTMFKDVDRFLAASNDLKELLIKLGAPAEKVKVWRLGVDLSDKTYIQRKQKNNILMVGRFVEKKGFEYGIKGFAKIIKKGCKATLSIIGDGSLRTKYEQIIQSEGIVEHVNFLGVLDHKDVLETMQKMDILLAPSVIASNKDRDSGLIVAKEAAARFMPVIGSYHGGIPEIIEHEKTGFLCDEKDVDAIALYLERLLRNPDLQKKQGEAGRKKMEKEYNIVECVKKLEEHYDDVIEQFQKVSER